ncbi:hypothetical protein A6A40_19555 (plasmid) [Azospirillum humicireducens]|uniref:Uncharacterized protein n=1 Tax=Azospirillum humicireducens TaxID=1226968 RepID=A0A2R4VS72_9PROT|nr:hypothetical protein A6A40_19555 [Azospirillum humicireducens]
MKCISLGRAVTSGDPTTVRWMAERLGLFDGLDRLASRRQAAGPPLCPLRRPMRHPPHPVPRRSTPLPRSR